MQKTGMPPVPIPVDVPDPTPRTVERPGPMESINPANRRFDWGGKMLGIIGASLFSVVVFAIDNKETIVEAVEMLPFGLEHVVPYVSAILGAGALIYGSFTRYSISKASKQ